MSQLCSQLFINLLLSSVCTLIINIQTSSASIYNLPTTEIIENNGYLVETHEVTTHDGFILHLHRIPCSFWRKPATRNFPVLIQHGIFGSSADWVLGGAKKSLPMQLADIGYDVWMPNSRGNTYSREHTTLNRDQKGYWDFGLHELGTIDLPAAIDFILEQSNKDQLHFIGFSMGTTMFYVMASVMTDYQKKIRSQISLAPVAYLSNATSIIARIAPYAERLYKYYLSTNKGNMLPKSVLKERFLKLICIKYFTMGPLCMRLLIYGVNGRDPVNFDEELIPYIIGHYPMGSSAKVLLHFAQLKKSGKFCRFNYGEAENKVRYDSSKEPPLYDLQSIKVPTWLFYGNKDTIANEKDVLKLKEQLPKLMNCVKVDVNGYFNHADFMWSKNVSRVVNQPIMDILTVAENKNWVDAGPKPDAKNDVVQSIDVKEVAIDDGIDNDLNNIVIDPNELSSASVEFV